MKRVPRRPTGQWDCGQTPRKPAPHAASGLPRHAAWEPQGSGRVARGVSTLPAACRAQRGHTGRDATPKRCTEGKVKNYSFPPRISQDSPQNQHQWDVHIRGDLLGELVTQFWGLRSPTVCRLQAENPEKLVVSFSLSVRPGNHMQCCVSWSQSERPRTRSSTSEDRRRRAAPSKQRAHSPVLHLCVLAGPSPD